jgi:small-conductance mechanosensitive channel
MMLNKFLRYTFPFQILFCLPVFAFGFQEIPLDSIKSQVPQPIPVVRIFSEIETTKADIELNSGKVEPGPRLIRIDSLYPEYKKLLTRQEKEALQFISSNPNRQKIDNLIKKWKEYDAQLSGWQNEITEYTGRNMRLLESFRSESQVWALTYDRAQKEKVPVELLASIKGVMDALAEIEKNTIAHNNTYLRLQSRINGSLEINKAVIAALYEKKNSETYDLFHFRHPPFWQLPLPKNDHVSQNKNEPSIISDSGETLVEWFETHREKLLLLLFIGIVLFAFVFYVRKQIRVFNPTPAIETDTYFYLVLQKPILTSTFLWLFISKLMFSTTPRILDDFLTASLLILSIFIVQYDVSIRYRRMLYFAILFLLLNSIKTYFWFSSTNYRLFMLVEILLFLGVLLYYTRPYRLTKQNLNRSIGKLLVRLIPVIYVLGVISVISNILGYTNLADFLLKVSINSSVISIIAYALYRVLASVSQSWLAQRYTKTESSQDQLHFLEKKTLQIIRIAVVILFIIFFLILIDEWRNLNEFVAGFVSEPYKVGELSFTLGSIFMFLLVLFGSYMISRLVAFLFSDDYGFLHFFKLPKGIPSAISLVLRYSIIGFGIVLALAYLNVDLSKFNLMAGALGLGIGFGLQTVISNFVSGLILVFERPILPGDTVEVNNLFGKVKKIGIRACNISTFDGAEVVVPNNNLISNDLINWTLSDSTKRVEILIGAAYGSDPNLVLKILEGCACKFEYVLKTPEPLALFSGFGESSLDFRLLFWVPFEIGLRAKSDVNIEIYNQFKENHIEIPFPQTDLHIKNLPKTPLPKNESAI